MGTEEDEEELHHHQHHHHQQGEGEEPMRKRQRVGAVEVVEEGGSAIDQTEREMAWALGLGFDAGLERRMELVV